MSIRKRERAKRKAPKPRTDEGVADPIFCGLIRELQGITGRRRTKYRDVEHIDAEYDADLEKLMFRQIIQYTLTSEIDGYGG